MSGPASHAGRSTFLFPKILRLAASLSSTISKRSGAGVNAIGQQSVCATDPLSAAGLSAVVDSLASAFFGGIVISLVSLAATVFFRKENS
jgi:hypothetical protein